MYYKTEPSVNEEHLLEIAGKIGDRWKRVANDLGFKTNEVVDIEEKSPSSEDRCYCMLQSWKDKLAPHYSGQKDLAKALERCGHRDLVAKLWHDQKGWFLM